MNYLSNLGSKRNIVNGGVAAIEHYYWFGGSTLNLGMLNVAIPSSLGWGGSVMIGEALAPAVEQFLSRSLGVSITNTFGYYGKALSVGVYSAAIFHLAFPGLYWDMNIFLTYVVMGAFACYISVSTQRS